MRKLIEGVQRFLTTVHAKDREVFERLASGQDPETMIVACADSRVVPHLITQAKPGDIFVHRNAGNIVPPSHAAACSEAASIEFGVQHLRVRHIIVLGHTDCGAMRAIVSPEAASEMPLVASWLKHAEEARRVVREGYGSADAETQLAAATEANVLAQIENLQTYPLVARARAEGRLVLHGWVWDIATGMVRSFDAETGRFELLTAP